MAGNTTVKSKCVVQKNDRLDSATETHGVSTSDMKESIDDGCLNLTNGKKVPLTSSAVSEEKSVNGQCMPVSEGRIVTSGVPVLRDTGCSGVIVKQKFILDTQYIGRYGLMQAVDNTVRRVPMATVDIESPYLTEEVLALRPPDSVYDLIVGNVSGARAAGDSDTEWHMANVVTARSTVKRVGNAAPVNVRPVENWLESNRDKVVEMQGEDASLQKYYMNTDIKKKGLQEVKFEVKDRLLRLVFKHPHVNNGKPVRQVVVPEQLRKQVMEIAHDSMIGVGQLGIRKTVDRIVNHFYWPAIHTDVSGYCRSCDICQRTSYQYLFELRERLEETLRIAREELGKAQVRQKRYYDRKARERSLEVGNKVLLLRLTDNNKLIMQWKGPYHVEAKRIVNEYRINVRGKSKTDHITLLKKYQERVNDGEVVEAVNRNPIMVDGDFLERVCSAIIADDESCGFDDAIDDSELLGLGACQADESWEDVINQENLTKEQKGQVRDILTEFQHFFTDLPVETDVTRNRISLTTTEPIRNKPYPVPYSIRQSLKEDISKMLLLKIVRESHSPYSSPVVVVRKKDDANRVCVDYRKLNKVTVCDEEHMTLIVDLIPNPRNDRFFTKIYLSRGYWQVPVAPRDIHKTTFSTPDGVYECLRIPFGMVNSGATLTRAIRKLLKGMKNVEHCVDDILLHITTWDCHVATLRELSRRLAKAKCSVRPSKTVIGAETFSFVGHQVGCGTSAPLEENLRKVRNASRQLTKKDVRSFLGLTEYYRKFVPNYSIIAVPLTDATRKGQPDQVIWGDAQEKAYTVLKAMITSHPILQIPDYNKPFFLQTDASEIDMGLCLCSNTG